MNHTSLRASRAKHLAVLFGTASVGSLGISMAHAQGVNEVLITGSLITGTPSVGVPVTNLGSQDFAETGAISVLDLLETVPALTIPPHQLTSIWCRNSSFLGQRSDTWFGRWRHLNDAGWEALAPAGL